MQTAVKLITVIIHSGTCFLEVWAMAMLDIICFSHLRWNFVYQRPQHLLNRFAQDARVFFIEEPFYGEGENSMTINQLADNNNITIIVPRLEAGISDDENTKRQKTLIDLLIQQFAIENYLVWYYSPMALAFSDHLSPAVTVYDCMDELSAFKFAPPELKEREAQLMSRADLVFTGGHTLYEAKKNKHRSIFSFPSSIDKHHFIQARNSNIEPEDQLHIPHPRFGFYGVLDERLNIELIDELARLKPDWQFILIGPMVKIDPASLPRYTNVHYLGGKDYKELPAYLSGWDIAIMPFAINESTRFISPTKTPEYLCGGKPVISTSITDVVNDYGRQGLVAIADSSKEFIAVAEEILAETNREDWLMRVDDYLSGISWDITWQKMKRLIDKVTAEKLIIHDKL